MEVPALLSCLQQVGHGPDTKLYNLILCFVAFIPASATPTGHSPPSKPPHGCPNVTKPDCPTNMCIDKSVRDFAWTLSIEYHAF